MPFGLGGREDDLVGFAVPFVRIDAVRRFLCPGDALVCELEVEPACFPFHGGRPEFDFDGCHCIGFFIEKYESLLCPFEVWV